MKAWRLLALFIAVVVAPAHARPGGAAAVARTLPEACVKNHYILSEPCDNTAALGTWAAVSPMHYPRRGHTATRLKDGRVLVVGGWSATAPTTPASAEEYASYILDTAEIYDPQANRWTLTTALNFRRLDHQAVLLADGRVLVAGSFTPFPHGATEIYDPDTGNWERTGTLNDTRIEMTLTALPDGTVLAAGGIGPGYDTLTSVERFDPRTGRWTRAGDLVYPRLAHTATLLPGGRVLMAGGACEQYSRSSVPTAEIFDASSGASTLTGWLAVPRQWHSASLLPDGRVLVAGGYLGSPPEAARTRDCVLAPVAEEDWETRTAATETFSTAAGWRSAGNLSLERSEHRAVRLADGRVMVTGGSGRDTTEIFDAARNAWIPGPRMTTPRTAHTATLLDDGRVLVTGGNGASTEIFTPLTR